MDNDHGRSETLSAVHPDILQSHILTRLDGPTLAAVACASSELHSLSIDDKLWRRISSSTWPSIDDPRITTIISTFPAGYRSFFSDSYPLLHHHRRCVKHHKIEPMKELISAVDIYYKNSPVLSKVVETEADNGWFLCSPFRVDLLHPKEYVRTWVRQVGEKDAWIKDLEQNLTLSWIVIDQTRKRAVNLSSMRPVKTERHWLTGETQAKFAVVMAGNGKKGSATEYVECEVMVTCGGKDGGEMHVRDVAMVMGDMEGKSLTGEDTLVIMRGAMERGERKVRGKDNGEEVNEKFWEFLEKKKERKVIMEKKEQFLDMVFIGIGITIFVAFWCYVLFR